MNGGRCENFNCKPDNWFGTYSPLYVNTWCNRVVDSKYIRKDYDGYYGNNVTYNNIKLLGGIGMTNREKYKNELMDVIKMDGRICGFVKKHDVFRMFGTGWESFCEMDCIACGTALQLWLDEEYMEPPKPEVDWDNVPVDTLVRVRDYENEKWYLRYFKGIDDSSVYTFVTWDGGATSITACDDTENWKYCELVEDEDDGSN